MIVALVDAAWSPVAAIAAIAFFAIHVILLVRTRRTGAGRRSASGTTADWAGVLVAVIAAAISLARLVLDHGQDDPAEPQFEIIVPAAGSPVGQCVLVQGLGTPKAEYRLWTVVQSDGTGLYYPRRPVVYDRISEPTSWSVATEVGLTNQPNPGYDIVIVLIPDDVSTIWTDALKAGSLTGYSELPTGSREVDRVSVSRDRGAFKPCTRAGG